jgi:hypothetical protein
MLGPAAVEIAKIVDNLDLPERFAEEVARTEEELADVPDDLRRLQGADVFLVFIESYGRALFRNPVVAERFREWTGPLEARLEEAGFASATGYLFPSVSGGGSSLAHAELLAGIPVENRRIFGLLLKSDLDPLPRRFQRAGYHTINVQPAMTEAWPEGRRFFGFDEDVFQFDLPYRGREYHWGLMPDQFAWSQVLETRVQGAERPLFVQLISVTSHAPFTQIPEYLEDWDHARDPEAFAGDPARVYDVNWSNYSGHPRVEEAYLDTIHYSLRTSTGFAARLTRPSLVLVLGDHQPPVVGALMEEDPSYDVPLHVLANREFLIAPFLSLGLTPGLVPARDAGSYPSARFLAAFLRMFSTPETK